MKNNLSYSRNDFDVHCEFFTQPPVIKYLDSRGVPGNRKKVK